MAKFNTADGKRHYVPDVGGSTAAVLSYDGATVISEYDYYPFGAVLSLTGADDRYKYTGKELDDGYDVDLYYYGARYYDAGLGRFISPDPIRWYTIPYDYCANNPVNFVDPDGRTWGWDDLFWHLVAEILADEFAGNEISEDSQERKARFKKWGDEDRQELGPAPDDGVVYPEYPMPPYNPPDGSAPPDATHTWGNGRH